MNVFYKIFLIFYQVFCIKWDTWVSENNQNKIKGRMIDYTRWFYNCYYDIEFKTKSKNSEYQRYRDWKPEIQKH